MPQPPEALSATETAQLRELYARFSHDEFEELADTENGRPIEIYQSLLIERLQQIAPLISDLSYWQARAVDNVCSALMAAARLQQALLTEYPDASKPWRRAKPGEPIPRDGSWWGDSPWLAYNIEQDHPHDMHQYSFESWEVDNEGLLDLANLVRDGWSVWLHAEYAKERPGFGIAISCERHGPVDFAPLSDTALIREIAEWRHSQHVAALWNSEYPERLTLVAASYEAEAAKRESLDVAQIDRSTMKKDRAYLRRIARSLSTNDEWAVKYHPDHQERADVLQRIYEQLASVEQRLQALDVSIKPATST